MFYSCFIESVLTFAFICWFESINLKNRNRLQGIVNVFSKIAGTPLTDISLLHKTKSLRKAKQILPDPSLPLASEFKLLPSGHRFCMPRCRTGRFKKSWVPAAIGLLNNRGFLAILSHFKVDCTHCGHFTFFYCYYLLLFSIVLLWIAYFLIVTVIVIVISIVLLLAARQIAPQGQ